jgi:hypothetical protein
VAPSIGYLYFSNIPKNISQNGRKCQVPIGGWLKLEVLGKLI